MDDQHMLDKKTAKKLAPPPAMSVNYLSEARKVFEIEAKAILDLKNRLDDKFSQAVEILASCQGKIVVTGMGKSGLIGRKIASTLTSTGSPAIFLHPAESSHGDLGLVTDGD